jgi:spermidine synthase
MLFVPAALMGATYPLLCAAASDEQRLDSGLYAANTLGAALGCVFVGFFAIGRYGVLGSGLLASAGNLACALAAWQLGRAQPSAPRERPAVAAPQSNELARFALAVAFGCGGCALAAEVLWTRALLPYLNSSSYAFAAILGVYLVCVAVGAAWGGKRVHTVTRERTCSDLALAQLVLGATVACSAQLMDLMELGHRGYVGARRVMSLESWLATVSSIVGRTALVIAIPTFLMGASFPFYLRLARASQQSTAGAAGRVSAANTLGGIVGSTLAGFVLLPQLGVVRALALCGAISLALGLWLGRKASWSRLRLSVAALGCCATLALCLAASPVPFVGRLASSGRILLVDEGPQDTTAVVATPRPGGRELLIFSNGVSYTGDNAASQRYMQLLGHLPVLLADDPSRVLVICIGTGMTAAAVARHREVRELHLVDISPAVHRTLPLFDHVNARVYRDPRVRIHEADGRQYLGQARERFGVVTLEPPPPRAAGAASLYTTELYERIRARLTPHGVAAQWLPLHGLSDVELRLIARSFQSVFPDAALFMLNQNEAALLGSPAGLRVDLDVLRARLHEPRVAAALARIGFDGATDDERAAQLLALEVAHGAALARALGPGPLITDDLPLIEHFAATLPSHGAADELGQKHSFLRRLLCSGELALPSVGEPRPQLAAARRAMHAQLASWAQSAGSCQR